MKFTTSICHPNVDESGYIKIDILKEKWSSELNVAQILLTIRALLAGTYDATKII